MGQPLPSTTPHDKSLPASQALALVELCGRFQVPASELLEPLGLSVETLEEPGRRLPLETMSALFTRARRLTGEPGLGFYLGLHKRATYYGYLGFAAMSASTLREAIALAAQFTPAVTTTVAIKLQVEGEDASIVLDVTDGLGEAQDMGLISLVVGLMTIGATLTGTDPSSEAARQVRAELSIPEPAYYPRFAHLVPQLRFGQPLTRIVFDAALLDVPLVAPDRAALRLAKAQCEDALRALGFDGDVLERTRALIVTTEGFRSLPEVAAMLHMSRRTLKRRLAERCVTYSTLLERARHERALLLLSQPERTLQDIAERLGYSSAHNFARAFRRWTGQTPAAYRRDRRRESSPVEGTADS